MRKIFEALMTILLFIAVLLAALGTLFMLAVGASHDPIAEEPIFIYISVATIVGWGIFCIYLWVASR